MKKSIKERMEEYGHTEYLYEPPPRTIPPGRVLVHNVDSLGPNRLLGSGGFRAWLCDADYDHQTKPCDCGWRGYGPHHRTQNTKGESRT
jgi:hypothetical protein